MSKIVAREIFPILQKHLEAQEITILVGPRQSGKTTLLKELIRCLSEKKRVEQGRIYYFNLDLISDLETLASQSEFIKTLKAYLEESGNRKIYVFVDEAQRINNAGVFFKGIYDLGLAVKFVLSGSSVLEIKSKLEEPLTGRKRMFHLYPFSFGEYVMAADESSAGFLTHQDIPAAIVKRLRDFLDEYLIYGGYPKVALAKTKSEKIKTLEEIYSSYIDKDIVGLMRVGEPLVFNHLVRILAAGAGTLTNINSLSAELKVERRKIENFISLLEKTFIIKVLPPYYFNVRKTIKKQPKIYFLDQGILNFATNSFSPFSRHIMRGQLLENFIASQTIGKLSVAQGVFFWRTRDQAEVDFVITTGSKIIPAEVKAGDFKTAYVSHSMSSFIKHYAPQTMYVINLSLQDEIRRGKTRIKFIFPWQINQLLGFRRG